MTTYTGTGIGLSAGASGTANRSTFNTWLNSTAASGDIMELDGFFPFTVATGQPGRGPTNLTIRAATPGATQGFDFIGTGSKTYNDTALRFNTGLLMQGLTFTSSDIPLVLPVTQASVRHQPRGLDFLGDSVIEYCLFEGLIWVWVYLENNASNITFRHNEIGGASYGMLFRYIKNSEFHDCYLHDAAIDNIKNGLGPGETNDLLLRNMFIKNGRDCFDLAGQWDRITVEDSIFMGSTQVGFDAKTDKTWGKNRNLIANRVRFVDINRAVATDCLNKDPKMGIAAYEARMPADFIFTDCSFERTAATSWPVNWLLKGGDRFTYVRPKYYGSVSQGFAVSEFANYWPDPNWEPTNYDADDANKEVYAARAAPTMDLLVGPANYSTGAAAPFNFTVGMWTLDNPSTDGDLTVDIISLPASPGSSINALEYQLNGAGAWTSLGGTTATTYTIPGLTNGQSYNVTIRAVNTTGPGGASDIKSDTPTAAASIPFAFTAGQWVLANKGTGGTLTVTISSLPSNGGSAITALQRRIDTGSWVSLGGTATGDYDITGLTNNVEVSVTIRAVNAVDADPDNASDAKLATPSVLGVPVNTALPVIAGTGVVGTTHIVGTGEWTNEPLDFTYGANIDGSYRQTGPEYIPIPEDIGKDLTFGVRATNAVGNSLYADTAPITITADATPTFTIGGTFTLTIEVI